VEDDAGRARTLNRQGLLALKEGKYEAAQQRFEEALELLPPKERTWRGLIFHNLGFLDWTRSQGDNAPNWHTEARRWYDQALRMRRPARGGGNLAEPGSAVPQ
jgi:hypothetical protein